VAGSRPGDFDHIVEMFASFGPVAVRRMFGGAGIYADGVMFALLADGEIYLKADATTQGDFEAEGMGPFAYETGKGKRAVMSYWRMPARLYDEPEELARWARAALAVAQRSAAGAAGTKTARGGRGRPPKRRRR
jgi:DNA transformation protein